MNTTTLVDVVIVGAGPAGNASACHLRNFGFEVVVLEREHFPRYHIGESLLPLAVPLLLEMGIDPEHQPWALRKEGAVLFHEEDQSSYRVSFDNTLPGVTPYAYQVERSGFDQHMVTRAQELGAVYHFGQTVIGLDEKEDQVEIQTEQGTYRARYVLNASGQDRFIQGKRARQLIRGMGKHATFTQYDNVGSAKAREIFARGDILLFLEKSRAWRWAIPLPGNKLSVGQVEPDTRETEQTQFEYNSNSPLMDEILAGARQIEPIRRCSNFSYYSQSAYSDRVLAVGDANGFLDPIFSSGVSLALRWGKYAAHAVAEAISLNRPIDSRTLKGDFQYGYTVLERIIERFYRPGWALDFFFNDNKPDDIVRDLNTILAGELWRTDNSFQNMLVRNKRRTLKLETENPSLSSTLNPSPIGETS